MSRRKRGKAEGTGKGEKRGKRRDKRGKGVSRGDKGEKRECKGYVIFLGQGEKGEMAEVVSVYMVSG